MIERDIEKKLVDKVVDILDRNVVGDRFQVIGTLQPDIIKAKEEEGISGLVVVRVSPRSYSSPTIPECQIDVRIQLTVRADIDFDGRNYIDICDILLNQYEIWQKCLDDAHIDFSLPKFTLCGYQLGQGDTSIDPDKTLWQYTQSMTLFGIVEV